MAWSDRPSRVPRWDPLSVEVVTPENLHPPVLLLRAKWGRQWIDLAGVSPAALHLACKAARDLHGLDPELWDRYLRFTLPHTLRVTPQRAAV